VIVDQRARWLESTTVGMTGPLSPPAERASS
jgi:hypothetical protein